MTSDRRRQESPKANIKGRVDATSPQVGAIAYGLDFGVIGVRPSSAKVTVLKAVEDQSKSGIIHGARLTLRHLDAP